MSSCWESGNQTDNESINLWDFYLEFCQSSRRKWIPRLSWRRMTSMLTNICYLVVYCTFRISIVDDIIKDVSFGNLCVSNQFYNLKIKYTDCPATFLTLCEGCCSAVLRPSGLFWVPLRILVEEASQLRQLLRVFNKSTEN